MVPSGVWYRWESAVYKFYFYVLCATRLAHCAFKQAQGPCIFTAWAFRHGPSVVMRSVVACRFMVGKDQGLQNEGQDCDGHGSV